MKALVNTGTNKVVSIHNTEIPLPSENVGRWVNFDAGYYDNMYGEPVTTGWIAAGNTLRPYWDSRPIKELQGSKIISIKVNREALLSKGINNEGIQHYCNAKSQNLLNNKISLLQLSNYSGQVNWTGYNTTTGNRETQTFSSLEEFITFALKVGAFVEQVMGLYFTKVKVVQSLTDKKEVISYNDSME